MCIVPHLSSHWLHIFKKNWFLGVFCQYLERQKKCPWGATYSFCSILNRVQLSFKLSKCSVKSRIWIGLTWLLMWIVDFEWNETCQTHVLLLYISGLTLKFPRTKGIWSFHSKINSFSNRSFLKSAARICCLCWFCCC